MTMYETSYRPLTAAEIAVLKQNNCSFADGSRVAVAEAFVPDGIRNCRFDGTVRIGKNVVIDTVHSTVCNYEIGDNAFISHIESLTAEHPGTFGGGTKVAVLNEAGGREVPLYNGLTAQIAFLVAMYRHRPQTVQVIERLIDAEIRDNTPVLGQIGAGSYLAYCGALTDVCIGECAVIQGVSELKNGTVNSTADSPTTIGRGVILRDFIVADGAEITDRAQLEKCFVGQGCRIGKGFTAVDTLFFANCECEQGEACAVFAGPYTVTHHKSTLLIGGLFSFYNAGSGTNMSNHMYRLGPIHQGVLERGCKTGSGSYILFPAHIGAFSVVIGRHDGHADTSHLPFSYLTEREGRTVVLPGQALKSIGLARDLNKWPERDRRKGVKRDHITFGGLNPYTIGQIFKGLESPQIGRGKEIYQTAVEAYLGDAVLRRIQSNKPLEYNEVPYDQWVDLAGLIAPAAEVERLFALLPAMHSIHELNLAITGLHEQSGEWEWGYALSKMGTTDFPTVIERGLAASEKILNWQLADATKEYAGSMRVSYADDAEFTALHGTPENHPFLQRLKREFAEKAAEARQYLQKCITPNS
jgi:hypothetical protein